MKLAFKILIPLLLISVGGIFLWSKYFWEIRDHRPAWSPGGNKIIFISDRTLPGDFPSFTKSTENVWVTNPDGKGLRPLTHYKNEKNAIFWLAWSPDGRRIFFGKNENPGQNQLWMIDLDTGYLKPLFPRNQIPHGLHSPRLSPDGKKILFVSKQVFDSRQMPENPGVNNIWVMNSDGSDLKPLTKITVSEAECRDPEWSPDGSRILFQSARALDGSDSLNKDGILNLWIMDANGDRPRPLTWLDNSGVTFIAQWFPKGEKILFIPPGAGSYWEMKADGTEPHPLWELSSMDCFFRPTLSPNDQKFFVKCQSDRDLSAKYRLWIFDMTQASLTPLFQDTQEGFSDEGQWSPKSDKIVLVRSSNPNPFVKVRRTLWIVDADGKNLKPLTGS